MATHSMTTAAARLGKQKGEIIAHAIAVECLGITGMEKQMKKNASEVIAFRRFLPYGASTTAISGGVDPQNRPSASASAHLLSEGVTPSADTLTPVDVNVTLQEYGVLYAVTNRVVDLYEDDIPAEMKTQTGERVGLVREMVRWGAVKACTNKFYSGGTSRATVDERTTLSFLRGIARSLRGNHAGMVRQIIDAGTNEGTRPIEASYLVFGHTDCVADWRDLPGFTPVAEYARRTQVHEHEVGSCEEFRFIASPELSAIADSGAAVGTTGLKSTSASNIDIYPIIVTGKDAWGQVGLQNSNAVDVTWLPPGKKDKNDPLGQRGYVGASFYFACSVLNNGWMAVGEVGVTNL